MINPMALEGRRILVTGASSGIGRATAVLASRLGAEVILTARRADELEKTRLMMENPDKHRIIAGDLSDFGFLRQLVEESGALDGLVSAAGVSCVVPTGLVSEPRFESVMRVNCHVFVELMNQYAGRRFRADRFSAVAVSSVSSRAGWAGGTAYCASKGALSAAVRAMAVELAGKGVRVNAVCPSSVDTPLIEPMRKLDPAGFDAKVASEQPLGLAAPEQVASVICFLLSDAAAFVTGVELPVDGGYLAKGAS